MTMQPVGGRGALLTMTREELWARGTDQEALNMEEALALVREGAALAGLTLEHPLELEAYPQRDGLLLFVRSLAPRRVWHPFLELEALLDAARDLGPLCAAAEVVWFGGLCCLTLPAEARQARRRLSGFASPPEDAAAWEALALGDGSVRLSGRALALLLDDSREKSV